MSLKQENIGVKIGEESLQVSPLLPGLKFGEVSCTPSQQIDLLGIKGE